MKKFIRRFLIEILLTVLFLIPIFISKVHAQAFAPEGTDQLMNTPLSKIQLNAVSAYAVIRIFGQAYAAIRSGGGLKGIFNALVYGSNAPVQVMQDYREEIGLKTVPVKIASSEHAVVMDPGPISVRAVQ